jgi:2-methylcitrate dehydratase PrpD
MNKTKTTELAHTLGPELARYAAASRYEDLPAEVADRTKLVIFDELGCELIGRELPAGEVIARYVKTYGGTAEAQVVGTSERAPAALAALANGTAGHADEFDAPHATSDFRGTGHPAAVIVPAAAAMAQRQTATGSDLVNAVALGYDVGARVISTTDGLGPLRDNHSIYAGSLHSFGAAAACARLLGLDAQKHLHAAALAAGQSISLSAFFGERRHMSKAFVEGQSALAGVSGAIMASMGFEANDNIYETPHGVLSAWGVEGRAHELTKDLGVDFAVMGVNFKFYSAGYPIHSAVEAALNLTTTHNLDVDKIEGILVQMPSFPASVVNNREMPTICLQDMLAVALVAGRLGVDEAHSTRLLTDPRVRRLRNLIELVGDPEFDREQPHGRGSRVTIDGPMGSVAEKVEHPRGHRFRTPAPTWSDLREKWQPVLEPRLGSGRFDELYNSCQSLEMMEDVRELGELVGATSSPAHI